MYMYMYNIYVYIYIIYVYIYRYRYLVYRMPRTSVALTLATFYMCYLRCLLYRYRLYSAESLATTLRP